MNSIADKKSPLYPKQEYIWFGKYEDGSYIYECDDNRKETSFDDIEQDKIKIFGILGNGIDMSFNKSSGEFNIFGRKFFINIIKENGSELSLSQIDKDLITFKLGHTDGVFLGKQLLRYERFVDGYFFGFKTKIEEIHIQIVFGLPVTGKDRRPFFGVKISSENNKSFRICLSDGNNNYSEEKIQVEKQKSSTCNLYFM